MDDVIFSMLKNTKNIFDSYFAPIGSISTGMGSNGSSELLAFTGDSTLIKYRSQKRKSMTSFPHLKEYKKLPSFGPYGVDFNRNGLKWLIWVVGIHWICYIDYILQSKAKMDYVIFSATEERTTATCLTKAISDRLNDWLAAIK